MIVKWMLPRAFAAMLALLCMSSCNLAEDARYRRETAYFVGRDAETDAQEDFRAHHLKIYSAMGVGQYYPGVTHDEVRAIKERWERVSVGTSDLIESGAQERYERISTGYAARYNAEMVRLLDARPRHR